VVAKEQQIRHPPGMYLFKLVPPMIATPGRSALRSRCHRLLGARVVATPGVRRIWR
jgi:hypothetical protein